MLGIGFAAVWSGGDPDPDDTEGPPTAVDPRLTRGAVVVGLVALLAWSVTHWPPAVAADGGWPGARAAADRIGAAAGDRSIELIGLPTFKSTEAYGFPLEKDGRVVAEAIPQGASHRTRAAGPGPIGRRRDRVRCAVRPRLWRTGRGGGALEPAADPGPARRPLGADAGPDDLGLPAEPLTRSERSDLATDKSERRPPQWAGVRDPRDPDVEGGIRADGGGGQ